MKKEIEMENNFYATHLTKGDTFGVMSLYLDFINLFIMMLEFFGNRRN